MRPALTVGALRQFLAAIEAKHPRVDLNGLRIHIMDMDRLPEHDNDEGTNIATDVEIDRFDHDDDRDVLSIMKWQERDTQPPKPEEPKP